MKTRTLILGAIFLMTANLALASAPKRILNFKNLFGQTYNLEIAEEQPVEENFNFDLQEEFKKAHAVYQLNQFDIRPYIFQEAEVEEDPVILNYINNHKTIK